MLTHVAAADRCTLTVTSQHNVLLRGYQARFRYSTVRQVCLQPHTLKRIGTSHNRSAQRSARRTAAVQMTDREQGLQSLRASENDIRTDTGSLVLSGCFTSAYIKHADTEGILLGVRSSCGPRSLQDLTLGKVQQPFTALLGVYIARKVYCLVLT